MTESGNPTPLAPGNSGSTSPESGEEALDAAGFLLKALSTRESSEKRRLADLGLGLLGGGPGISGAPAQEQDGDDHELFALLLRQKYLAAIEEGHDAIALTIAEQMIGLGTLGDVARQDAARAALATGNVEVAIGHLRIAARVCPASRRAFHYAHLGSLLRFDGQMELAIDAFSKAIRWATEDRDIYRAQQALAEAESGRTHADLEDLRVRLENDDPMKAYSLWILGELCVILGDTEAGASYLRRFLSRQNQAPRAKALSLKGEVAHASALLKQISA